jgi:hydroxylamine reductase
MENMFCYQCEQTARGIGCTASGVCGKKPDVAHEQDVLTCEMIALAEIMRQKNMECAECVDVICDGLFTTITNVNFDTARLAAVIAQVRAKQEKLAGAAAPYSGIATLFKKIVDRRQSGEITVMPARELFHGDENMISLRSTLLFGLRGMAAYMHHARVLGKRSPEVDSWLVKGMAALAHEHSVDEWLRLLMELGSVNLTCMALLDEANTGFYGNPVPTVVPLKIEKGPFLVVTGHDLHDLKMLLEQTDGKGVNVYTHSEMLPAHGYPELKKHPQLKGNFGTAWQNQQKEFENIPAPVLYRTNCLMPVRDSYGDRVAFRLWVISTSSSISD